MNVSGDTRQGRLPLTLRSESAESAEGQNQSRSSVRNRQVKTTIALHMSPRRLQKAGGVAAFIDAEHALDPVYAKALGVDIDNLLVSQPDSGEQALEITEALVQVGGGGPVLVVDSVAALVPQQEIDGEMGAAHVGVAGTA